MIVYTNDRDGNPKLFNLNRNSNGEWLNNNNGNLDNKWNGNNRFVFLSRKLFHFSLNKFGEFCFISCPFQPPSILPISSNGLDKCIYFLSSSDFVSQSIIKSIFIVSNFCIASRTQGCFSVLSKKVAMDMASIISINKLSIF